MRRECADPRCGMFRQAVKPIAHPDGGPSVRCPVCLSTTIVCLEANIPDIKDLDSELEYP